MEAHDIEEGLVPNCEGVEGGHGVVGVGHVPQGHLLQLLDRVGIPGMTSEGSSGGGNFHVGPFCESAYTLEGCLELKSCAIEPRFKYGFDLMTICLSVKNTVVYKYMT